ncbi:AAEL013588-PA, partial [Aedes aegypti]
DKSIRDSQNPNLYKKVASIFSYIALKFSFPSNRTVCKSKLITRFRPPFCPRTGRHKPTTDATFSLFNFTSFETNPDSKLQKNLEIPTAKQNHVKYSDRRRTILNGVLVDRCNNRRHITETGSSKLKPTSKTKRQNRKKKKHKSR